MNDINRIVLTGFITDSRPEIIYRKYYNHISFTIDVCRDSRPMDLDIAIRANERQTDYYRQHLTFGTRIKITGSLKSITYRGFFLPVIHVKNLKIIGKLSHSTIERLKLFL